MKKLASTLSIAMVLGVATFGSASLTNIGNGLIFDADINRMWIVDANLPKTLGLGYELGGVPSGGLTWQEAKTFADSLVYAGYDDWRLPSANDLDGSGPF